MIEEWHRIEKKQLISETDIHLACVFWHEQLFEIVKYYCMSFL